MGNGALPNGPSYRAHPRLYLLVLALPAGFWVGFAGGAGAADDNDGVLFADLDIGILHLVRFRAAHAASPKPHLGHRAGGAGFQIADGARNWRQYRSDGDRMPVLFG